MREVYALEDQPKHTYHVYEVHHEHERVVELCSSELSWRKWVQNIAEKPISESEHCNVHSEKEKSWRHKSKHVH